ncbi:MAG: hypothetical protein ACOY0T_14870 [Myxococcota bacterium]
MSEPPAQVATGPRPAWIRRLAPLLLLVPVFLLQEAAFRFVFPLPELASLNRAQYGPRPSWLRGPPQESMNCRYYYGSKADGAEAISSLNAYGFRDKKTWKLAKTPGEERVMFVGDSFVEGLLSDDEHTIPVAFAEEARRHGKAVEVMNMGLSGTGVPDYLRLIRDTLPSFKPDTLVVVFYANDFPTGPPPRGFWRQAMPPRRVNAWEPRAKTVIERAFDRRTLPRRPPGPILRVYEPVPHQGNPLSDPKNRARFASFVDPILLDQMEKGETCPWLVNHLGNARALLPLAFDPVPILKQLRAFVTHQGVRRLLLAYVPHGAQVSDYYIPFQKKYSDAANIVSLSGPEYQIHAAALASACSQLSIEYVDLSPALRAEEAKGQHLYWNYDNHMRPAGYAFIGRSLWEAYARSR